MTSVFSKTLAACVIGLAGVAVAVNDPDKKPVETQPAKPETKPETKPEAKAPEAKPEAKPEVKPEIKPENKSEADAKKPEPYVLGYSVKTIDGTDTKLDTFKGKVVLFVNVASRCGYTPQYSGLEKLYKSKKDAGFVILGFPANNFGGQEPGTNKEIAEFCKAKYDVSFPMFEKISVLGADSHPLFKQLAALQGEPKWNFTKYLVDRKGNVVAKYDSRVKPDDAEMTKKIEELLAQK